MLATVPRDSRSCEQVENTQNAEAIVGKGGLEAVVKGMEEHA